MLQRALLHEVAKDGADGGRFLDAGDDPHGATAVDAGGDVATSTFAASAHALFVVWSTPSP
ncbi:TPA: hypothetical protein ACG450_000123 [Stenotrophomonas maltophilia]